ncbi:hypothetical protein HLV37_02070 [Eggerthellaceae bacterium zg-1084]|uniref:cell wall-binding repeat-containing protein n=1 Tax=Berryella wangjianweii TaxID=2734634 RepID=UPI001554AFC4|nr:cell wall-binding repeat-containing protein [Berryella wangjianweii]NPD30666.1 hypothetical protein [Berryella wangjianweii]
MRGALVGVAAAALCSVMLVGLAAVPAQADSQTAKQCFPGIERCSGDLIIPWDRIGGQTALDTMERAVLSGDFGFVPRRDTDHYSYSSPERPAPDCVVVCTSEGWWDALSASGLAGIENAPVLMTTPGELSSQAREVIERLRPSRAIVVGGEAAVSARVESQLAELVGSRPERIWGDTAVDTSLAVLRSRDGWSRTAFVATSATFQDALSAGPYAYARRCPVVLADARGILSPEAAEAVGSGAFDEAVVLGGEAAIPASETHRTGAASPTRVWGATAVGTCASLIDWAAARGYRFWGGGVATVYGYHDALVAAACCGRHEVGLALVGEGRDGQDAVWALARAQASGLREGSYTIAHGTIYGGEAAVPQALVNRMPFSDVNGDDVVRPAASGRA